MGNYEEGWFGQKGNGWIVAAVIVAVAAAFWIFGSTAWFAPNGEPFPCGSVVSPRFSTPGPCTDKLEVRRNVGLLLGAAGIGLAIIGYYSNNRWSADVAPEETLGVPQRAPGRTTPETVRPAPRQAASPDKEAVNATIRRLKSLDRYLDDPEHKTGRRAVEPRKSTDPATCSRSAGSQRGGRTRLPQH